MKKKFTVFLFILCSVIVFCSCFGSKNTEPSNPSPSQASTNKLPFSKSSTFCIQFIDVGQGDSALIECDGHYMLIDAGDKSGGKNVYSLLVEKGIQHLDFLAISHLHEDHIGGLVDILAYTTKIDKTISNSDYSDIQVFKDVEYQLGVNGAFISIPHTGDKYKLGSADIEVIDCANKNNNDSLVLMITYGKTRFLFTGDIEFEPQSRISDRYVNEKDEPYKIDLIKMPHHGSSEGSLYRLLRTFEPTYAVISVGEGNRYGHPDKETLDLLKKAKAKVYRTDQDGNIIVKSDGKELSIETEK